MELSTGHLVRDLALALEETRSHYTPIPRSLLQDAERELKGRDETYVDLNQAGALPAWARNKKRKNRARAKLAKASRKRNRAA